VRSVAFSPDGSHVVSGSEDRTVRIWNVVTGECEAELKGHSECVKSVAFSPDGSHVVSGSFDRTMRIWNVVTGECEAELPAKGQRVNSVDFSPDGSHVASGSGDRTVRIWNVVTGECEAELKGHSGHVNSVVFSPDGSYVVSGSLDRTVRIWNIATGASSILADRALLQDGIYVYHRPEGFYISPPLSTTTETPSVAAIYLSSSWFVHAESGLQCWLPPQYRNIQTTASHNTLFCIGLETGLILAVKFYCSS
jgi:WD40 repeat protein